VPPYAFATPNPYGGTLSATYTQSLLRGFGKVPTTANLVVARMQAEAADHTFRLAIIRLVADTETQYWDLVCANRNLANKRLALELAQKHLQENTLRVRLGAMAAIEVISAESQVARAEQDIIAAEAQAQNARDILLRALYPKPDTRRRWSPPTIPSWAASARTRPPLSSGPCAAGWNCSPPGSAGRRPRCGSGRRPTGSGPSWTPSCSTTAPATTTAARDQ